MLQALNPLDATSLLTTLGTAGVFLVLFAETGLMVGFFLPGDSLLFTAGLLCATTRNGVHFSLPAVLAAAAAGALLGAQAGYLLGRRAGRALLARTRGRRLADGVARAEELLSRYGHGKAIVLARFVPVVRTVLNPLAGIVGVPTRTFALWQAVGGLAWTAGLVLGGYALGSSIPNVDRYLLPLIAVVVAVSLLPLALLRSRRRTRTTARPTPGSAK
ncbi:DedA family protein [Streptomyces sp. V3I7]|uniref:DedA family protein n=1 Tax=Streptomyces sp. V3I7 TaxID=3042278 RepID=UPI002780706E|nr:DedA family protein [Streptomyces sp. V3I7]MDQ0993566.1 membrane-associated protein [Streptomyces sp. V3I7]